MDNENNLSKEWLEEWKDLTDEERIKKLIKK